MNDYANGEPAPSVGMGATLQMGSDMYPYTIIEVSPSGHRIRMQRDRARPTKNTEVVGMTRQGAFVFIPDPEGTIDVATRRSDGRYRLKGCKGYGTVTIGRRHHSLDPHF